MILVWLWGNQKNGQSQQPLEYMEEWFVELYYVVALFISTFLILFGWVVTTYLKDDEESTFILVPGHLVDKPPVLDLPTSERKWTRPYRSVQDAKIIFDLMPFSIYTYLNINTCYMWFTTVNIKYETLTARTF